MKSKVIVKDNSAVIFKRINAVDNLAVTIGVHDDPKLALIAAVNEFGSSNIPARPFLRTTFKAESRKAKRIFDSHFARWVLDRRASARASLEAAGEHIAEATMAKIEAIKNPPNAPSTIRQKGFDNPLVHTGKLKKSITVKVVDLRSIT